MKDDYKDLLIQLLLDKLQAEKSFILTASATPVKAKRANKPRHKWTREQKLEVLSLKRSGVAISDIAQKMGLRRQQVDNMIYALEFGRTSL